LTAGDLAGITLEFDPDNSFGLDLGKSLDFTAATVSLSLGGEEYDACTNPTYQNPFLSVDRWELRFKPVRQKVLYYNEICWEYDYSGGPKNGPFERRQIIPIADGRTWIMYDSENPPVTFEFDDDGVVGTHVRNGETFNNVRVTFTDTGSDTDDVATMASIEAAVNNTFGETFTMRVWEAWKPEVRAALELLIAGNYGVDGYLPDYRWEVGRVAESEPIVTTVADLNDGYGAQFLRAGDFKIGVPWNSTNSFFTYGGITDQVKDGATLTLDDGVHAPTTFEFDNDEEVTAGHVRVPVGMSSTATMANLIAAINGANNLDITAEEQDPPAAVCQQVSCTLWQVISGQNTQVGTISMTADWFTIDPETNEAVVTLDQVSIPGEYWYSECAPIGVWVWTDRRRENAWHVQLLYDPCYHGGAVYGFCVPGTLDNPPEHVQFKPGKMACKIVDPWESCGYELGSDWSLTPHYATDEEPHPGLPPKPLPWWDVWRIAAPLFNQSGGSDPPPFHRDPLGSAWELPQWWT
jgi:hypothetical protein